MPFILFFIAAIFAIPKNFVSPGDLSSTTRQSSHEFGAQTVLGSCEPNLELDQTISVVVDQDKRFFADGTTPLYLDKESKSWVLIKRSAPVPAWKVLGGRPDCRFPNEPGREIPPNVQREDRVKYCRENGGVVLGEMEKIGKTADTNQDVYIGLGHCNGDPSLDCRDPLVQDALFVVEREGLKKEEFPECMKKWPDAKSEECAKTPGYWWEMALFFDRAKLPENPTTDDLPCWTRLPCSNDFEFGSLVRRRIEVHRWYQEHGQCPEDLSSLRQDVDSLASELSSFEMTVDDIPPTPTPTVRPRSARSLKLEAFFPRGKFAYEWWTPACKPAIYLYPEKPREVSVKVAPSGRITQSIPEHGRDGWKVVAYPDGTIRQNSTVRRIPFDHFGGGVYPYLYYEAEIEKVKIPQKGWIVKNVDLYDFFTNLLPKLGLNQKETQDFLDYWIAKLSFKKRWFIGLIDKEELERVEPIVISPPPDSVIRVRFYFEELDDKEKHSQTLLEQYRTLDLRNLALSFGYTPADELVESFRTSDLKFSPSPKREGFTAVDWGGIIANGSCGLVETSE